MMRMLKNFSKDESGAVTVDWVVLTAAVVGLGLVVMTTIRPGISAAAASIQGNLTTAAAGTFGATP
jgi:Flp pilus assembly pilin Flp